MARARRGALASVRDYLTGIPPHYRRKVWKLWEKHGGTKGSQKLNQAKRRILAEDCIYPIADELECRYADKPETPPKQAAIADALVDAMNRVYDDMGWNEPLQPGWKGLPATCPRYVRMADD